MHSNNEREPAACFQATLDQKSFNGTRLPCDGGSDKQSRSG